MILDVTIVWQITVYLTSVQLSVHKPKMQLLKVTGLSFP